MLKETNTLSFFETSNSDIILIKQLDTAIKHRTNNTFTIQHKNHAIWGLSFIIISSLLFFIFLKDDKNSKSKKTESKQKIKKQIIRYQFLTKTKKKRNSTTSTIQ